MLCNIFYSLQECNAVLFIFDTPHTQKLTFKISSSSSSNVLGWAKCSISTDSLFDFLKESNKRLPPPNETIVDKGRNGNLRIFVYKFDKRHVTQCSKASADDFMQCDDLEKRIFTPNIKLIKNVGWSFFVLIQTQI